MSMSSRLGQSVHSAKKQKNTHLHLNQTQRFYASDEKSGGGFLYNLFPERLKNYFSGGEEITRMSQTARQKREENTKKKEKENEEIIKAGVVDPDFEPQINARQILSSKSRQNARKTDEFLLERDCNQILLRIKYFNLIAKLEKRYEKTHAKAFAIAKKRKLLWCDEYTNKKVTQGEKVIYAPERDERTQCYIIPDRTVNTGDRKEEGTVITKDNKDGTVVSEGSKDDSDEANLRKKPKRKNKTRKAKTHTGLLLDDVAYLDQLERLEIAEPPSITKERLKLLINYALRIDLGAIVPDVLTDMNEKFEILNLCCKVFDHNMPNQYVDEIKTTDDVIDYFLLLSANEIPNNRAKIELFPDINFENLPPNLYFEDYNVINRKRLNAIYLK